MDIYIYNKTSRTIPLETAIPFSNNSNLVGITHNLNDSIITIINAGTYAIWYSVSGTESNQFAIFINGTVNETTIYGSGAGTQQNNGMAILTLLAGAQLTIVNHTSAAAITLAATPPIGGTAAAINASVLIQRLG